MYNDGVLGILYNDENTMLETAFKSSVDVAKAKIAEGGVKLDVVSKIVPLYDSFETQHFGKRDTRVPQLTKSNWTDWTSHEKPP